jgi:sortase A
VRTSLLCLLLVAAVLAASCSASAASDPDGSFRVSQEVKQAAEAWQETIAGDIGVTVGTLVITRIGLQTAVLEGTDTPILEKGPGHWEETPLPGEGGRCVISAHRSTFGSLFLRLDELEPGDAIELRMPYGVVEYEVFDSMIVTPDRVDVVRQRGFEELSLATCHPPGSGEFRLVVHARAVGYRQAP